MDWMEQDLIDVHTFLRVLAVTVVMASFSLSTATADNKGATGTILRLEIIDSTTGKQTPARIEVRNRKKSFIAEDPLPIGGDCVGVFKGDAPTNTSFEEAFSKFKTSILNPYTKKRDFYTVGTSEVILPPGKYRIIVTKGPEFYAIEERITVKDEKSIDLRFELERIVNMPALGWYSGDDHIHIERTHRDIDPIVLRHMMAEDIHVGNTLHMGRAHGFSVTPQYAHGEESYYQEGDYLIATGQENLRTHLLGHQISLGADSPLRDLESYLNYPKFWRMAIEQGGINGHAHTGGAMNNIDGGPALYAHHGLVHFVEVLQFNQAHYHVWYDLLNLGFRLAPTGGTDYPCVGENIVGKERFYAHVKGKLTYKKWLKAIEKGKTFVSNGPFLSFRINSADIGDELKMKGGRDVEIYGKVEYDPKRDWVNSLELIQNGRSIYEFPNPGRGKSFEFKIRRKIDETSWFALRTDHHPGFESNPLKATRVEHRTEAHTAPIYVTLKDAPALEEHSRTSDIAKSWMAILENLEIRINDENIERTARIGASMVGDPVPAEVLINSQDDLMGEIDKAKKFFSQYLNH
ncbi:MAG: CehA/McbA family metallohydrolase [Pseudomonadota bacterium]